MGKQSVTIEVDLIGKVESLSGTISKLQGDLNKLNLGKGLQESFKSNFAVIASEIEKIQNIAAKKKINVVDDKQIQKSLSQIETAYASVLNKLKSSGIDTAIFKQDEKAIKAIANAQTQYTKLIKDSKAQQQELNKEIEKAQKLLNKGVNTKGKTVISDAEFQGYKEAIAQAKAERDALEKEAKRSTYESGIKKSEASRLFDTQKLEQARAVVNQLTSEFSKMMSQSDYDKKLKELQSGLDQAKAKLVEFNNTAGKNADVAAFEKIKKELLEIQGVDWSALGIKVETISNAEQLSAALEKLSGDAAARAANAITQVNLASANAEGQLRSTRAAVDQYSKALQEMTSREREIEQLKSRVSYFFGLANAVNLARRAMRSAFNTVKELDAAMTETAVVTDFSVGDMWDQLPRYTDAANKLGATTLGAYQTMTLFYQQGLDTSEAFALGTETMKMARIAGLDYADATDKMTAALRGFNMELSETSAQRVNDVYSELAAITAADTEEIANAMTKTASIAHNANMEFETTAAFLSQIIETTRESAETAGTAMKTVIARFQELKKDPAEIGEVDGEIVDANKIETALRSVGVALRDSTGQFRDLDDVFLELASKWDGLDTNTQRYIATIAAGSRQQSRFIAMMSNYERTMELVSAANNSAGASQQQFDKTLESLEAKLNKLKNAWNEFTMGITNNQAIKAGVDILTGLLNVINKVTGVTGNEGIGGLITAISKLALAWTGLRAGKAVLAGLSTSLSKAGVEAGITLGQGLRNGFAAEFSGKGLIKMKTAFGGLNNSNLLQTKALAKYRAEMALLTAEQAKQNAIMMSNSATWRTNSAAVQASAQATINMRAAETAYLAQLKLSEAQITEYNAIKQLGISVDQAGILAKNGVTEAGLREIAISELGQAQDEKEIIAKMALIAADKAEELEQEKLALSKGKLLIASLFNTAQTKREMLATLEDAGAKQLSTFWTEMLTIATWQLWIAIAAIAAIIAVVIVALVNLKKNSPEAKLQAAADAASNATEKVGELVDAYNELTNAIDAVQEKRTALDDMIYGTQEWRDAVKEVNQEMLEIAKMDPDLAPFITNNNGVLEFDYNKTNYKGQTYDEVMAQKESDLEVAQQYEAGAKIRAERTRQVGAQADLAIKYEQVIDNYTNRGFWSDEENNWLGFSEIYKQMAQDAVSGTNGLILTGNAEADYDTYVNYLMNTFDMAANEAHSLANYLIDDTASLLEFGSVIAESNEQISAYTDSLVANAVENSGFVDEEADIAQTYLDSRIDAIINSERKKIQEAGGVSDVDKYEYARIMGYTFQDGAFYSKDENGKLVKEDVSDELIAEQVAYSRALKIGSGYMTDFTNRIGKVSKKLDADKGKLLEETYAEEDGLGITRATLNTIDKNADVAAGEIYDALEAEFGAKTEEMFGTRTDFIAEQTSKWEQAEQAYKYATDKITSTFSSEIVDVFDGLINEFDLTAGEAKALSNALYDVGMNGGDVSAFLGQVGTMLTGLTGENRDRALALINSTDWTDKDSVEATIEGLKDLGVVIDDVLTEEILKATKATREFSMDRINDELKKTSEAAKLVEDKIESGEVTYTQEEAESLISLGADSSKFVRTDTDEFVYIGETNELLGVISGHTAEILGEMRGDLEADIAEGRRVDAFGEQESNIEGFRDKTNSEVIEWLKQNPEYIPYGKQGEQIIEMAGDFGIDIEGLSPQGIIDAIIQHWDTYAGKADIWQGQLDDYNTQLGTMEYANMDYQDIINQGGHVSTEQKVTTESGKEIIVQAGGMLQLTEEAGLAVDALAAKEAGFNHVLSGVTNTLQSQGKEIAKDTNLLKIHTLEVIKSQKEVDKMNEVLEENNDILKNGDKKSTAYGKAISEVTKEAKKVFGDHIKEPFVEANIEEFLKLEEGGQAAEEAWDIIIQKSYEAWMEVNGIVGDKKNELLDIVADIDGLEFGIDGTADFSSIFNQLAQLLGSAEEAAEFIRSLGFNVTWTESLNSIGNKLLAQGFSYDMLPANAFDYKSVVTQGDYKGTGSKIPSGGGGGGGSNKTWENPYDEFYNLTEEINEELRTREKIEQDYDRLLKDRRVTIEEIRKNQLDQIASLRRELDLQQQLLEGRKRQLSEIAQETYADGEGNQKSFADWGVTKYASYDQEAGVIKIDWEGIDQITDEELGGAVEAYISQIEEWASSIEDIEDELRDIEDKIDEIKEADKDNYLELEERIYDALVEQDQKVIDAYQELSDTMGDSNEKILNSLQESIDLERQIRDNTKTEEDIADKEARLAYLRRDTSGANDLEIQKLEEELADARESYGDTLVDQELDRLNKLNEEAVEQREKQIELMQAQLDYNKESGAYWGEVNRLISEGVNSDGSFKMDSELVEILKGTDAFIGMSEFGQMNWIDELVKEFMSANNGFANWMIDKAEQEKFADLGNGITASYDTTTGTWTDDKGNSYKDINYNVEKGVYELINPIKKEESGSGNEGGTSTPEIEKPVLDENTKRGVSAAIWRGSSTSGWGQGSTRAARLKEVFGENDIQENYVNKNVMTGYSGSVSDYTYANMKKKFLAYKTGGLADFTGPAWLDGTKARPELVLNQQDTQNFIQLKDILSSLFSRGSVNTQTSGDNYYNFDITVEEIGNDYDVDQLIERVKERIHDDASYRNVNAINFLR